PKEGTVKVDAYASGQWVIFRVTDEGPGVPIDKQRAIFEKFYRTRKKGTGLGLAISKAIVEAHRGEIGIISDGKKGSTFFVKLPKPDGTTDTHS
ncbi:MAG: sensor histidine kinase, partial [Nitrospirae bacterium]